MAAEGIQSATPGRDRGAQKIFSIFLAQQGEFWYIMGAVFQFNCKIAPILHQNMPF